MAPIAIRSSAAAEQTQDQFNQTATTAIDPGLAQDSSSTAAPITETSPGPSQVIPGTQVPGLSNSIMQLPPSYLAPGTMPALAFTREQLDARFALEQQKFEADLAAIKRQTARKDKESLARIAVIQAGAVTAAAPHTQVDEEEPIGEISPAALLVASRYPGLPKAKIARIFANKFRPENLYKLRHLKGREDKDREENVTIENGQMKLKRVTGTLRDFGTTWDIWCESFINYSMIMVDFFGTAAPTLFRALLLFWTKIRKLGKIYAWQGAILPLAIDYHTEITTGNHTDVDTWILTQDWIDQYCSPDHILSSNPSKKRPATSPLEGHSTKKKTLEICRNFNSKGCSFQDCTREHKCTECASRDHGAHACTIQKQ